MKADFYLLFETKEEAQALLNSVNSRIGENWDRPTLHPFNSKALVRWNLQRLEECSDLLEDKVKLDLHQAAKLGFSMGYHQGRFHRASQKLEDAYFIHDAMKSGTKVPNLPAYRSLFYGFQSSIYGVREGLTKACKAIGGDAALWWNERFNNLKQEETLSRLYDDYTDDKHGRVTSLLTSRLALYEYSGAAFDVVSGEGAFVVVNRGTARERRVFPPGIVCVFEPYLQIEKFTLGGADLSALPLNDQLEFVIWYFQDLLHEAKIKFGP